MPLVMPIAAVTVLDAGAPTYADALRVWEIVSPHPSCNRLSTCCIQLQGCETKFVEIIQILLHLAYGSNTDDHIKLPTRRIARLASATRKIVTHEPTQ